jgi:hypothetical protein
MKKNEEAGKENQDGGEVTVPVGKNLAVADFQPW